MFTANSPVPKFVAELPPIVGRITRVRRPEIDLPIYSKFSLQLLNSLPSDRVANVVSYSSLLTSQNGSPTLQESINKKQVVSYTPQSKIHEKRNNTISLNSLKFSLEMIPQRKTLSNGKRTKGFQALLNSKIRSKEFQNVCQKVRQLESRKKII